MNSPLRKVQSVFSYIATSAFIAFAAYWAWCNWDKIEQAFSLNVEFLSFLIPLIIISVLLIGLQNQVVVSHLGFPLRFLQWAGLAFTSTLANYILPMRAGAVMRAEYYKQRCGLALTSFGSSMALVYVTTLLANSIIGLCVMLFLKLKTGILSIPLFWGFLAVVFICLIALVLSPRPSEKQQSSRIIGALVRIHSGWDQLRRSPLLLLETIVISLALTVIYAIRLSIAFAATGHIVSAPGCLLAAALVSVSMFIGLTPASLGIREAAIVFASMAVGVTPEISLVAGAIDRAVAMLVVFILGPISMIGLSRQTRGLHNNV
jgi:uncharacterized membrane protein YbhN (UPF0104 family)